VFGQGGFDVGDGVDLFVPSVAFGGDTSSFLFEEGFTALFGVSVVFGGVIVVVVAVVVASGGGGAVVAICSSIGTTSTTVIHIRIQIPAIKRISLTTNTRTPTQLPRRRNIVHDIQNLQKLHRR